MSLLTDDDFLLRAFQLSYIRQVLPNHAPHSSRSGTGPYNLISFAEPSLAPPRSGPVDPLADPTSRSPYVVAAGLSDPHLWPELSSGRSSPPLALTLARDPSRSGSHAAHGRSPDGETGDGVGGDGPARGRRRRGGPGPLGYTQTIVGKGTGVGGAGMRVDGVKRSWKGKGKMVAGEADAAENDGSSEIPPSGTARPGPPTYLNLVPPPVVVHSPVRTPKESSYRTHSDKSHTIMSEMQSAGPPSLQDPNATITAARKPRFAMSANEYHSFPEHGETPVVESPQSSLLDEYPSRPNSQLTAVSTSSPGGGGPSPAAPSTPASPLSLPHTSSVSPSPSSGNPVQPSPLPASPPLDNSISTSPLAGDASFASSSAVEGAAPLSQTVASSGFASDSPRPDDAEGEGEGESGTGVETGGHVGGPISMASSGVSLFGMSRLDRSTELLRSRESIGRGGGGEDSSDQSDRNPRRRRGRSQTIDSDFSFAPPRLPTTTLETNETEASSRVGPVNAAEPSGSTGGPVATPGVPVFKLPPGLKVRERRRVNIRPGGFGGLGLLPLTPSVAPQGAEAKVDSPFAASNPTAIPYARSRSNTTSSSDPPPTLPAPVKAGSPAQPVEGPDQDQTSATTKEAPSVPPGKTLAAPPSPHRPDSATSEPSNLAAPSPTGRSPRRRSRHGSTSEEAMFPKRSSYIRQHRLHASPSSSSLQPDATTESALRPTPSMLRKSALTAMLTSPSSTSISSSNPFSTLYASCVSRSTSTSDTLKLTLYFPHCTKPGPAVPIKVGVKRDVTVEEVIGVGLWAYYEAQDKGERDPKLDVDDERAESGDETTRWNLRIVEDDGEVDEDFPALDRVRSVSAFSFTEFAIVRANEQQVQDNLTKQASITRRPSRILSAPKRVPSGQIPTSTKLAPPPASQTQALPQVSKATGFAVPPPATGATMANQSAAGDALNPANPAAGGTLGVSSALAVPVILKVRFPSAGPGVEVNSTIQVPSDMYLIDVLDYICRKLSVENPKDWALIVRLSDGDVVVPLDRTVESLGDQHEVVLVPRSQVGTVGLRQRRNTTNINPSASIFQHDEESSAPRYQSAVQQQLTSTYQTYRVQRKLPMSLGGRHPRTIAIDGDYLHFMPADGKDSSGRTSSFHISLVQTCKVSRRSRTSFKIVVHTKNRVDKRYDFEAENAKVAAEVVAAVRAVMEGWRNDQLLMQGQRGS
ncbi:hypothetical protein JCM10212_005663 [Sporobolomyces blumeae]